MEMSAGLSLWSRNFIFITFITRGRAQIMLSCRSTSISSSSSSSSSSNSSSRSSSISSSKGKADPLQYWSGQDGFRMLRFTDLIKTAQDGGKVVSLTRRPPLPPGNTSGTHIC